MWTGGQEKIHLQIDSLVGFHIRKLFVQTIGRLALSSQSPSSQEVQPQLLQTVQQEEQHLAWLIIEA